MATYFYDGMPNVNERLNQLYNAFAAGPYNALPLTGGTMTGPLTTTSTITAARVGTAGIIEQLALLTNAGGAGIAGTAIRFGYPGGSGGYGSRIVGAGDPTLSSAGYTAFEVGAGGFNFREIARFTEQGSLLLGSQQSSGTEALQVTGTASIIPSGAQGSYLFKAGIVGANSSIIVYAGDGQGFGQPSSVMYVAKNSNTDRSSSNTGTVNTSGNDYAEYIFKSEDCGTVQKGQIIGITSRNTVTDLWADAVMFAIKSTDPSFVGGDTWASPVGARPMPQAGTPPPPPPDGGERAEYEAEKEVYATALRQDAEALHSFEIALEEERQKVDRIAIAGRVPVNVLGAQPGDYIVPVQERSGITGIPVRQVELTHLQYLQAVGRVISIESDGRAYVMVKVV